MVEKIGHLGPAFQKPPSSQGVHAAAERDPGGRASFATVLKDAVRSQELKFSAHALARMTQRKLALSQEDMARLQDAVDRAAGKGARESLILMDDLAFIVSVRGRTVITAVDGRSMKDNVFTNIDSAVIISGPDLMEGARGR